MNDRWQGFNSIARDGRLRPIEKALLLVIYSYNNAEKGYSHPSVTRLMAETPIKDRMTFFKNRKSLVDKGYLRIETIKGKECHYFITIPSRENLPSRENQPGRENQLPPSRETLLPPSRENQPRKEYIKELLKEDIYINFSDFEEDEFLKRVNKIKLTKEDYNSLVDLFGVQMVRKKILELDESIENKKINSRNHFKTLTTWCNREKPVKSKEELENELEYNYDYTWPDYRD